MGALRFKYPKQLARFVLQGNCSGPVPGTLLDASQVTARQPRQCAIVIDTGLLNVLHGNLWMDNLFIAVRHSSRFDAVTIVSCGDKDKATFASRPVGGSLWLTRTVTQGESQPTSGSSSQGSTGVAVYGSMAANGACLKPSTATTGYTLLLCLGTSD